LQTKPRREDRFIDAFLSAYENLSWSDADKDPVDRRLEGAVEVVATRKSDGKRLAIEHTLIQPFVDDKADFASFAPSFLKIEQDTALVVPGKEIKVFVPVGTLRSHNPASRGAIVSAVHEWIRANRMELPDGGGQTEHQCKVAGTPGLPAFEIKLTVKTVTLRFGSGMVCVRRQQVSNDFDAVVRKALTDKLRSSQDRARTGAF
jgi:hypothetical protein